MLQVNDLSVSFHSRLGQNRAVENVTFELKKGQTLGIVGESGSGKSVTCYSILGLIPSPPGHIDHGEALFEGQDLLKLGTAELRAIRGAKISMIFQDPMTSLNPFMRIGDQIQESIRLHEDISREEAQKRCVQALEEVGITNAAYRMKSYPHEFSGGMRQRVMIAMALATQPDVLIADEPTTALDVTIQAQILRLLQKIQRERELSIIFISHDLAVVRDIANDVLVMKDGVVVERGAPAALFESPSHPYTKKLIDAIPRDAKPWAREHSDDAPLLSVRKLNTRFLTRQGPFWKRSHGEVHAVRDISLDIQKGEILGLVGESGSGKSTFGRSVMRLVQAQSGEVLFEGQNLLALEGNALKTARRDFQMIFQDPYASLNPRMTVFETLAEPLKLHRIVSSAEFTGRVNALMDEVGLPRSATRKYPHEFSGGQRQRIAIARAIASRPKLIVADEPVSALDVTIQAQILKLLLELSKEHNLTMLFISHDMSVVRYLCDRVAVMQAGELVEVGATESLFQSPQHDYTRSLLAAIPKAAH